MSYEQNKVKNTAIWISIAGLGLSLVGGGLKGASAYGALEQQVTNGATERADLKARIVALERTSLDLAVLRETVRNMDMKLAEIKQILQERSK